jgi:transcriptional regulator with XRE-family HTH domain
MAQANRAAKSDKNVPQQSRLPERSAETLADTLAEMRARSQLTQAQVARRMATTQTAIARLESGRQSPSMQTLQAYARANGFCLEIGFVRSLDSEARTGCILVIEDRPGLETASMPCDAPDP